jgi:hypothetical protein
MSRLILFGLMALAFGLSDTYAQAEWKQFESSAHKFKVDYPAPVRESKGTNLPDVGGDHYKFQSTLVPLAQSFAINLVEDRDARKDPTDEQVTIRLNRARESAIGGLDDGKLIKEMDVRLNGLLGREVHIENQKFMTITRIYFTNKRMYLVMAVMMKSKSDPKDFSDSANRFLNSFELLK